LVTLFVKQSYPLNLADRNTCFPYFKVPDRELEFRSYKTKLEQITTLSTKNLPTWTFFQPILEGETRVTQMIYLALFFCIKLGWEITRQTSWAFDKIRYGGIYGVMD